MFLTKIVSEVNKPKYQDIHAYLLSLRMNRGLVVFIVLSLSSGLDQAIYFPSVYACMRVIVCILSSRNTYVPYHQPPPPPSHYTCNSAPLPLLLPRHNSKIFPLGLLGCRSCSSTSTAAGALLRDFAPPASTPRFNICRASG